MKPEVAKILEMHKSGSITSEQASGLLEELSSQPEDDFMAKHSALREKSLAEVISDTFSDAMARKFASKMDKLAEGSFESPHSENRQVASKVEGPRGKDFVFQNNSVTASHLQNLNLECSEFQKNEVITSHFEKLTMVNSAFTDSSVVNSQVREILMDHSEFKNAKVSNSEFRSIQLRDESALTHSDLKASSIKELSLDKGSVVDHVLIFGCSLKAVKLQQAELSNVEIHASTLKNVQFQDSSWMGVVCKTMEFRDFKVLRSHFTDVIFSVDHKWKRSGLRDAAFEDSHLKKVFFSNCRFQDVVFKNLSLENTEVKDLTLKDQTIDGNEAFLRLLGGTSIFA